MAAKSASKSKKPRAKALTPAKSASTTYNDAELLAHVPQKVATKVLNGFFEDMSKEEIAKAVLFSPDEKAELLAQSLFDPDFAKATFARLCHRAGYTLGEVVDLIRNYKINQVVMTALDRAPSIMEGAAEDASPTTDTCPRCDGLKKVLTTIPWEKDADGEPKTVVRKCPKCEGSGKIRKKGDRHARTAVFEAAGVAGKQGPAIVQNVQVNTGGPSLESVIGKAEEAITVNAEEVEEVPE